MSSNAKERNSYDAAENLLRKTDRNGHLIQYGYDALYRLTSKSYPDQTAVNYSYDPLSRLTQVTDPTGAYSFTYDNLGRLTGTGTQYSFLSTALTNNYGYDAASNRVSMTSSESGTTNYSYDSLNRLITLTDPNTGEFGFGYDALGRRISLTRPNGIDTSFSYDTLSRLLSVLHNNGSLPGSTSYAYDSAGNRLTKTAVQEASPNPVSVLSQYSYDNIYELTQAVVNGTTAESYSYDAVGNRTASAGTPTYNYDTSNELTSTSTATYTHDNNGNTLTKTDTNGTTSYSWDYENRLTQVTPPGEGGSVYFNYDPFGRRIRKSSASGTTIYAYDGDNVVQELGSSGSLLSSFTQGLGVDEPLAIYSGVPSYYHADGSDSITSLTNSAGNLVGSYVYDSFGNLTASTGAILNPFQYTGREFDSETGLYYYRARYYDPATGRFLSEDPKRFAAGPNFYSYVGNSPPNFGDPSGLDYDVSYANGTITVDLSVVLYGSGTNAALAARWQKYISDIWNQNPGYGKCKVAFNVTVAADPASSYLFQAKPRAGFPTKTVNFWYVPSNLEYPWSHGVSWSTRNSGSMWSGDGNFTVAHEAGHLLYLPDQYNIITGTISKGHENDLMAESGRKEVQQWAIDSIVGTYAFFNGCGCTR